MITPEDATTEDLPGVAVKSVERERETEVVTKDLLFPSALKAPTESSTSMITMVRARVAVKVLTILAVVTWDLKDPSALPKLLADLKLLPSKRPAPLRPRSRPRPLLLKRKLLTVSPEP